MSSPVIFNGDIRYLGPDAYLPPAFITGIPTQEELDACPKMFTWGEIKDIVRSGDLEQLMRNKPLQARYDEWSAAQRRVYGSTGKSFFERSPARAYTMTEKYLLEARLPWKNISLAAVQPAYPSPPDSLGRQSSSDPFTTSSTGVKPVNPPKLSIPPPAVREDISPTQKPLPPNALPNSHHMTPGRSVPSSGASTPSSAGFVSLDSLKLVNGKLLRARSGSSGPRRSGEMAGSPIKVELGAAPAYFPAVHRGPTGSPEEEEWEEDVPVYLKYDKVKGLDKDKLAVLPNDWPYNIPHGVRHFCVWCRIPIAHPELVRYDPAQWARIEIEGLGGFTGITPLRALSIAGPSVVDLANNPWYAVQNTDSRGRSKFVGRLKREEYYTADVMYGGQELRTWAGVEYESVGGHEVGKFVRGLWDPRGWECLWFVNPPRLQSVPGFSHFHVFARRKTPQEIDASEAAYEEGVWRD